jgi:hypothetical protein
VIVVAAPARAYQFIGYHQSGAFFFQSPAPGKLQACRDDTTDTPTGWPDGTSVGPGASCGDVPDQIGGKPALDVAKKETKGVSSSSKSVFGVDVKLELKDKKTSVVAVNGEKKLEIGSVESDEPLKITDQYWRNDGRFVVVVLKGTKEPVEVHKNISSLLVGGPAGHKLAQKLEDDGTKLFKKRDWSGAGKVFEDAIAADPDWAPARYSRAAAEAQGGVGRTAMIDNLQWLKEHADKLPEAKKLLNEAKSDSAFDAWIGDPEVRDLVGLPKVSSMDPTARLLERDGTWTQQGATCKSPWMTVQFKKGGSAQFTVADSCKGKKTSKSAPATYKQSPAGPFVFELKKPIEGMTLPAKCTIVLDDTYQKVKLVPDGGGEPLGTFEPGPARLDDSTL